jgi:5'-3' exonuclease
MRRLKIDMKLHIIIDFMHIYYKYFFQMKAGRMPRLSAAVETKGTVVEKDTTLIYYPLKDIESIRNQYEKAGYEVTISVCFDSKSKRKEENTESATEYKSGRKKNLSEVDLENLDLIEKALLEAGHNVYKVEGYEADDLVNHLVNHFKSDFDFTIIYTNDKDLFVNIDDAVGIMRYKSTIGYNKVTKGNYEEYLKGEYGVRIPFNTIGLFLATAGDSADKIKGINKFGAKAFEKLITAIEKENNIDWSKCGDYHELDKVVELCSKYLTEVQFSQLKESYSMVENKELEEDIPAPFNKSTKALRLEAYGKYNMQSLIL